MATSKLSTWDGWWTLQLKIVLLGGRNSGKSSVGNLILGKEEFVTKERTSCLRRVGTVAGRRVTVVDTPGWWCDFSAQDTPRLVKRDIVNSVSLCSPGPHAFLIVVKAGSAFSERRRRAVEEHVSLLGDGVWRHCLVVITSADHFRNPMTDGGQDGGGSALCWLSGKCGQRCHTVALSDDIGATELLVAIQRLVAENGNRAFEMSEDVLGAAAEEKRWVDERAQLRFARMKQQRSVMRERSRPASHIRIVLLGPKGSGKTSALNTILDKQSSQTLSRTARCWVAEGLVFGRQVTVVDTPGWWMNYFLEETTFFDQREVVLSLSLCPPGPHVFLLVIRVDRAFTENHRRAVKEHLELISEHIWNRVFLLFSFGDWLAGTTTEQYIESEGEALQWLIEKCGNRYHVLNSKTKGDGFQVRELVGKIEEMTSGCDGGWHYQIDGKVLEELERRMKEETERVIERMKRKEKQRQMARSELEKLDPLPELSLVLVGGRKSGKSSCGNTILNKETFDAGAQTTSCTEKRGEVSGKKVSVLDTPGCCSLTSDLLAASSGILLVVNVSTSFTDHHRKALEEQLEAAGGQTWSRTMVLFSHGDWLGDTSVEQRIESEGEALQRIIDLCGNRYHVLDNKKRGDGSQAEELLDLVEEMLAGGRLNRGGHMWKSPRTAASEGLKEHIIHQLPPDSPEAAESSSSPSPTCSEGSPAAAQVLALPRRTRGRPSLTFMDRQSFMSYVSFVLSSRKGPRWSMADLPDHISESRILPSGHPAVLLISCQRGRRRSSEEDVLSVRSLCRPPLRDRTLQRLSETGGLQILMDQWGDSSLEELEDFIDSYFEMVWEQTVGSFGRPEPERPTAELVEEDVLCSIDRKLSKLELLEEIRSDLTELKLNQESSWRAIQELRDQSKAGPRDTS